MTRPLLILYVFLLGLCGCGTDRESSFQFNLQPGKVYTFTRQYSIRQNGNALVSDATTSYLIEVTGMKDGVRTLKLTCQAHDLRSPSQNTSGDFSNTLYGALGNKSFYMKVDRNGKIVDVNGLKELIFPVLDTIPMPDATKVRVRQVFDSLGERLMAKSFTQGFDIFPNKPIAPGDTWQKEMQQDGIVPINFNISYTVQDIRDRKVYLRVKALKSDNDQKGELLGNYVVDQDTGLILEADIATQLGNPVMISTQEKLIGKSN